MTLKQKNERAIKRCKNQIAILFQKYGEELPSVFFRWMHVVCHHPTWAFCHFEAKEDVARRLYECRVGILPTKPN